MPVKGAAAVLQKPVTVVLEPESIVLKVEIADKAISKISFVPVLMDSYRTPEIRSLRDPEGLEIARMMQDLSRELDTAVVLADDEVVVPVR